MQAEEAIGDTGQIDTVQSLADSVNALNTGGIRWDIYQHKDDLIEDGSIFYVGNKLFIDRNKYIRNLKSRNK
jgi:hypothetical protein